MASNRSPNTSGAIARKSAHSPSRGNCMFACLHAPGNLALLVECAGHFSPLVEETSPDTAVFAIRGLQRIYGTRQQLTSEIQRRVGIAANLPLASNLDAAVHAPPDFRRATILPPR